MEYAELSNGDRISRIGHGCEPLGGTDWGRVDPREASEAVRTSLAGGVNVFDTAPVYGLGLSEERLRQALGPARKDAFIITKFGLSWSFQNRAQRADVTKDASPRAVRASVEGSLRRLGVDCVPIALLHWPDPATPIEDTMAALSDLRAEGKVRSVGLSNAGPELIRRAHAILRLTAVEIPYSLIQREAEDLVLPLCRELGLAVFCYGPLAQGLLTGKFQADLPFGEDDRRARLPHFNDARRERLTPLLARLEETASRLGRAPGQVALRWALGRPGITTAIVGAKTPGQAASNLGAVGWSLPDEESAALLRQATGLAA